MAAKSALLYRMVMDDHLCPFGIKSKDLLEREGYAVEDRHLETRAETDAFMEKEGVETTPQTFIGGKRIGGYDDLLAYFDKDSGGEEGETTYQPVVAIFATTALMALAASWAFAQELLTGPALVRAAEWFIAFSMCALAIQKLRDLEGFSLTFITYDLLGMRAPRYAYVYPFAEAAAGILMIAGALLWIAIPLALFIGTVGAVSVFKAVYIDKRDLKCACVGSGSNVPLGLISLTENLMMVAMAVWMLVK